MSRESPLTGREKQRYARQIMLPEIGEAGQAMLMSSSVLIVGAGGLGSAAGFYLAAAGVGRIGIVDSDTVEVSNLQRQILHSSRDVGRHKVDSASGRLMELNPDIDVVTHAERFTSANGRTLIEGWDMVVDACDNFFTRFAINDACVSAEIPFVHAGVCGFEGQVMRICAGSACLRCLIPSPPAEPESSVPRGILGAAAGCVGALEAVEVLKHLLGIDDGPPGRLIAIDLRRMRIREIHVPRDPDCPVCGNRRNLSGSS